MFLCFYHVKLLGDSSSAQLLHAVADVTEAGVVVLRVLLGKVIYVTQRTILERGKEGGERFTQGAATSCKRKADNLIGQNAATAETHLESWRIWEEKGLQQVFERDFSSANKITAALTSSELYSTLLQCGKQYLRRKHNNLVFQNVVQPFI